MVKHNLRVDMTPMVDLGFLLISFFVITTELSKPTAMNLYVPKQGPPIPLGMSDALTILLDKDNAVYYYNGDWKDAVANNSIVQTNYSGTTGIRNVIMEKQYWLDKNSKSKEGRNGLMMLIKPTTAASYRNVVDVLDEATINMVKKYAIVKITPEESSWLKERNN